MKKLYRFLTIFSLIFVLIFSLTFFNNETKNISVKNTNSFLADTDGITTTTLKSLVIKNHEAQLTFNASILEYSLDIFPKEYWLTITATASDSDAKVKIDGNDYLGKDVNIITITVSNGIANDTVYTIVANKKLANSSSSYTSVTINTYNVTNSGYYRLEVWGAQGGTGGSYRGGYGGYASGIVQLTNGNKLYIGVGGQGTNATSAGRKAVAGGYNGGGYGWQAENSSLRAGGGGGATHIALNTNRGILSTYNSYRGEVLIVAGGGAGGYGYGSKWWNGANGGGYQGNYLSNSSAPGTQSAGYAFGQGGSTNGSSIERGTGANQAGGGGGWYGGHAWWAEKGAGGGSGYIGNSKLISLGNYTKHMACVSCATSTAAGTYTISNSSVNSGLVSDASKTGSGGAKVTRLGDFSNNHFIKEFQVDKGQIIEEYNPGVSTYQINVDKFVSVTTITPVLDDSTAKLSGTTGKVELDFGYNYFTYTVTSQLGTTKTYTLVILREGLKGKHSSEIYKVLSPSSGEVIYMSENVYNYSFNAYTFQTNLDLEIYTFDEDATYTITGNKFVAANSVVRIVVSAPGVQDSIYILNINYQSSLSKSNTYSYTGSYQTFVAPVTGKYSIELWGSSGGGASGLNAYGGYTYGKIQLEKDQKLYIYVGQSGARANANGGATWNGGGALTNFYNDSNNGTGGGATDVRLVPTSTTTAWNEFNSLKSRIMVAGSGGGYVNAAASYGSAGGLSSYKGSHTYSGTTWTGNNATQTSGNALGRGADSARASGGGGYFGGLTAERAGAGGSSYISGHTGAVALLESSTSGSLKFATNASGQQCTTGNTYKPCSYHYSGFIFEDTKMIDGRGYNWTNVVGTTVVGMPNTAGTGTETGHSGNGYAKITALFLSNNNYLQNITTDDGEWNKEFDPEIEDYTITVGQYVHEVTVFTTKFNNTQTVVGNGVVTVDPGINTHEVVVTAEDGSTRIYTLNINRTYSIPSSEIYKFSIDEDVTYVEQGETEFDVDVSDSKFSFDVKAYPYDSDATITYSGFGYVKQSKTCYIIVNRDGANPSQTIYTINLNKSEVNAEVEFTYTKAIQTFKAPAEGYYRLEVWGAQGGNTGKLQGGYGAYSTGLVHLEEGDELYIGVGGQGTHANKNGRISVAGGWNGGGTAWQQENSSLRAAGGGGATHIAKATNRGVLANYTNYKSEVLIVGAGGAGAYGYGSRWWNGNSGGGYIGVWSNNKSAAGTQTSGYAFGQGGSRDASNIERGTSANQAGGGGGYYGGHAWWAEQGAGGGSSYIGNVTSVGDYTKHMTCYNCATNTSASLLTKSTTRISSNGVSDYAKSGNGFAKITYINFSSDFYLKNLKITDTSKNGSNVLLNENSTDDVAVRDNIVLNVASTVTNIKLESKPNDSKSTVVGNGKYLVKNGTNTFTITVTAENQKTKTYTITINRDADTNVNPDNIEINGLVQSLCKTEDYYCKLYDDSLNTNELTYDKDTDEYYMTVPSRIKQVKFVVTKGHYYQVVTGDGVQDLTKSLTGTTSITIDVMSEYCSVNHLTDDGCYSHYTYNITRDTASDTDLRRMFIDNKNTTEEFTIDPESDSELSFDFNYTNPDVYDYYFSVPNEWTNLKYLYTELDAPGQEVTIEGNDAGAFDTAGRSYLVQVHVLAPNKTDSATYRLHVYRELNSNIYLTSLSVTGTDSTVYPLNMEFKKSAFEYEVTIPYSVSTIDLNYTTEVITTTASFTTSNGTKSGNRISNIPTGKTDIVITTRSEKNVEGTYKIKLTRVYNNDSSLSAINVSTGSTKWGINDEDFNPSVLSYEVSVNEGIDTVSITPTLGDTLAATYKLLDNNKVKVGSNIKRILVTAENGTYRTYSINVIRPASTDNTLSSLTVIGSDSTTYGVTLETDKYDYTIDVPNNVNFVNVTGVKNTVLATLSGNGKYYLQTGVNNIYLTVYAEDGTMRQYALTINRAYNSNGKLKTISGSGTITPTFNESDITNLDYTINVDYHTTKMDLIYAPSATTTTVVAKDLSDNTLNGKRYNNSYTLPMNLVTGDNKVKLITLAEDKTTTLTYNVNVVKAPSNDATLKTLRLKETRLVSTNVDKVYTAKLPYNVDPAHLIVEVNDSNSNYVVTVPDGLSYDDETKAISGLLNETDENKQYSILVTVTAEDSTIEVYTIDLTMQAYGNASNYLTNLIVDKGTLIPTFDKDIMYYEVLEENSVTSIVVGGTLEDEDASVSGFGTYNLKVGENEINVIVTASDGLERVYQIIATRKPSSDATLKTLSINGASLSPSFTKDVYEYTTSVDDNHIPFSSIVTSSEFATFEVINNENGTLVNTDDEAIVTIKVTAEDKVTTQEYKITVTKLPSGNNNLASLSVVGYTLTPEFSKNTTVYNTVVENNVSTVLIEATSEDEHATITGIGSVSLATGVNNISVDVTSESGVTKSYLLMITREYSNNAFLELIDVNNGTLSQVFDRNEFNYQVSVNYDVTELDLVIVPEESNATYVVTGNKITDNTGVVTIIVTAEDKTTQKTYTLNVTKDMTKNALLKDLIEANHEFTSPFNSNIFSYNMTVNYEVTELDLTPIPVNPNLNVETNVQILGNSLSVGDNLVTVRVTSEDGSVTQEYIINVTRNKEVNNYLDYLFNDYGTGDFNEEFDKFKHKYTLTVDSDTESIILYGEPKSSESTVSVIADNDLTDPENTSKSYLGTFGLSKGTNTIKIVVTNQGYERTYYITITRKYNSDKELLSLIVKGNNTKLTLTPEFEVGKTNSYSLTVDKDTKVIEVSGTVSEYATVNGFGDVYLEPGLNVVRIVVTAEDGTSETTVINVTKEASTNANLIDLVPSSGSLNPSFGYGVTSYDLDLDSSVLTLYFDVTLEDANGTVSGNEAASVPDGLSTRVITVTAEDRSTTQTYVINIKKIISDDADLLSLKIKDYNFIDKDSVNTIVNFDKDTLEYYAIVKNSKTTLTLSDIVLTKSNNKAIVTYSDDISLFTKEYSEYSILITAEDGITKKNYKLYVKRELGSDSSIMKVVPEMGYLETSFNSKEYNYVWRVPVGRTVNYERLGAILKDSNATVETSVSDNVLTVVVTSEDESSVSTYIFTGKFDYNTNILIDSLRVFDDDNEYPIEPEVNDETFEYTAHVYEDQESVNIYIVPQAEGAKVKYNGEEINIKELSLPNDVNTFEIIILGEDGSTEQPYTLIIKKDIKIEKTISSLEVVDDNKVCTSKTCILTPIFDSNTAAYKTSVPFEYEKLKLRVGLNDQQSVKYYVYLNNELTEIENGNYNLELGTTTIYVIPYDLLGNQGKSYKLVVTRNKSTNTKLNALSVTKDGVTYPLQDANGNALAFSNTNNEYYITVPYTVEDVVVNYTKNDELQKVNINGYNYFNEGEINDISVKVIAPDNKTTRTIIIHAYRESQYEVFLTDITVGSGIIWNLSPSFDKRKTSYVVNVSNGTEYIKVEGSADADTDVSAAETRLIETGVNEFEIIASKTFDGEVHTKTYTVTVIRPIASEVFLSSLVTSSTIDGTYNSYTNEVGDTITFDKGTTDYYLEVSPGVKSLNIKATPGRDEWNVNVYGNKFATGKNIVSIIVYNEEYTTSRTYQLMVTVKPSQDSSLTGIKVYNGDDIYGISNEDFAASENNTYTVNVPYDVEKVSLKATPTIDKSVVIGEGEYYLDYGNNELSIYVEAEDGIHFTVYTVNVYRAYDLYLSDIKVNDESLEDFTKTNDTYEFTVTNDIEKITFEGIPEESNVTVSYSIDYGSSEDASISEDGVLTTGVGLNKVVITVTAPDSTNKKYYINVTREQSDNNYLEYLEFDEGIFREPFEKTRQSYSMYILDTYTSLDLSKAQIIPEDTTARYAVSGYAGLSKTAPNIVTVAVTSESGKVRNYTVEVILKPESFFMHYLKSLRLTYKIQTESGTETQEATLSPIFAQATRSYTVTVPYSVSSITTNAIPLNDDDDAILTASTESGESLGDASYSLDFGRNVISIKVTSRLAGSDGSFGMYKVIVYRSKNAVATLQSLAVKDHLLTPSFNSNRISYSINIDSSESKLDITAIPTDPGATVEILGNGNFVEGNNTITIKVTAADGTTIKNYYITANCTLSDNNYLSSIEVKDQSITPTFVKTNTGVYLANVDENVSNVYITAIKETTDSTMEIVTASKTYSDKNAFSMNLMPGNNFVYFSVRSAAGNIRTYTLNVFRSYSTDNRLKELVISDGDLSPVFDPEETNYTVILDNNLALLSTVAVIGFKNHNAATVVGNGEYTLNETGSTLVTIKVIAQSGDEREYKINFIKKEAPSSKLKVLDVHEGELDPKFSNDGYRYYLTVPYEVKALDLTVGTNVIPEDSEANVEITGNSNFKVGINIVTIKVTATNGDTKTYLIYVTRSVLASNYLADLYVEDQTIEPEFNSDTLYYTLTVGSNIELVHVYAEKDDPQSTLEINGSIKNDKVINLVYGENKVYFTVTSENGASRTYTLVITRSDSDEYYLLTLSTNLGTWDRPFDKDDNGTYVISVPAKTSMIVFSGTSSVGSTVEGLDNVAIKNGENTHKIVVTSPSGLKNTYNFTINRPSATNANATITSDQGNLTLDNNIYKRSVDDSVSHINFIVTPEDSDAKVVMDDIYHLNYGKNEITIKVIAEDGVTEKEYSIEIYRFKDIESISYDQEEIILNVGATNTPTYTINPNDTDYKDVTFRSDDDTIATVDSNGMITGVCNGITYVYVTSTYNSKVYDWIKVNVASTKITSSVYTVWHLGDSENDLANVDFSYVIGADDKTSINEFIDNFDNDSDNLYVYSNGEKLMDYSAFIGSGMILKLEINGTLYDEVTVIVRGDNGTVEKPGNGIITSTDYATLSSLLAGLSLKTQITSLIYDLNKNKILTVTDLSPLSLYIAGKATFTNLNGL